MKKLLIISGVLVGLIIIITIVLTLLVKSYLKSENLKALIIPKVEEATGRDVEIGTIDVSLFKGIVVREIEVKGLDGKEDLLKVDRFILDYSLLPLLRKQLLIKEIRFDSPHIFITRDINGSFNFQDIIERQKKDEKKEKREAPEKAMTLPVSIITDKILINDARIRFRDKGRVLPNVEGISDMEFTLKMPEGRAMPVVTGTLDLKRLSFFVNNREIRTTGNIKIQREEINFQMETMLEGDKVQVKGKVINYLSQPDIEKNIYSESLDLEKIISLIPSKKEEPKATKKAKKVVQAKAKKRPEPLKLTAHGEMKVKRATYKGYRIKDFLLIYDYKDEILTIKPLKCEITGGDVIDSQGSVDGDLRLRYSTALEDPLMLAKKTLKGVIVARLSKGEIKRSKITDALYTFTGIEDLKRLTFNKAEFVLDFKGGKIYVKGLIDSDHVKITPDGVVDMNQQMDIKAETRLSPQMTARLSGKINSVSLIKDSEGWTTIPLRLTGRVDNPSVGLDTSGVGKAVEKGIKKEIEKRLMDRLSPEDQKKEDREETKPEDILKGIFGE